MGKLSEAVKMNKLKKARQFRKKGGTTEGEAGKISKKDRDPEGKIRLSPMACGDTVGSYKQRIREIFKYIAGTEDTFINGTDAMRILVDIKLLYYDEIIPQLIKDLAFLKGISIGYLHAYTYEKVRVPKSTNIPLGTGFGRLEDAEGFDSEFYTIHLAEKLGWGWLIGEAQETVKDLKRGEGNILYTEDIRTREHRLV